MTLTKILTYHVVPGRMTAVGLMKAVKDGEGTAKLKTVQGEKLTIKQAGPGKLTITDGKGDTATVTIADVLQSNGVIHDRHRAPADVIAATPCKRPAGQPAPSAVRSLVSLD